MQERTFTADERKAMAKKGHAMSDGSFPIVTAEDLSNAIQSIGRASNPAAAKAHIIKRAKALGLTDKLPADWEGSTKEGEHIIEAVERVSLVEGSQGREWDIKIISPGVSKNGVWYEPAVLRAAAHLYEGARSYVDHGAGSRSFRDRAGVIRVPVYESRNGEEALWARYHATNPSVRAHMLESYEAGEEIGFSHDVIAQAEAVTYQGKKVRKAKAIEHVNSVDIVDRPSAGGKAVRLVAGETDNEEIDVDAAELKEAVADALKEAMGVLATQNATLLAEALKTAQAPPDPNAVSGQNGGTGDGTAATAKANTTLQESEALTAAKEALRQATQERQRNSLKGKLEATKLSIAGKALLTARFEEAMARRPIEDAEIDTLVKEAVEYEALFTEGQDHQKGIGLRFENGTTGREKFVEDLKAMFAQPSDKLGPGVRAFSTFKEAYIKFTGNWDADIYQMMEDYTVKGGYISTRDHDRFQESLNTAAWGQIFADVMYQSLINAYMADPRYDQWRQFCSHIEPVPDFRTRHWMRIGGYGDLPAVAEGQTYTTTTSPTDEEATYVPTKRGFLDDITMEAIVNDQVGVVTRLVREMGRAAARTLYKFVLNMLTTDNANTTYDSTALYVAGHSNTGTTALSVAGLDTTQIAMFNQTGYNQSLEILGDRNQIKFIIVPNTLTSRARRIVDPSDAYTFALSSTPDGDTAMDPQRWKGSGIVVHTYHQLTDVTDWWAVADPNQVETIVMGFLGGRQEPEFFTQDQPQTGSVFTADKISYKTRFVFGGTVVDHRSLYRQVVAG